MKYSIIFLNYDPLGRMKNMADKARASIIENSKDYELIEIKNVTGFVCAVNEGFRIAKGDFIVFVANDVEIQDSEWLNKMCKPDSVFSWTFNPFFITEELMPDFSCWGVSKEVFSRIGLMDEQFKNGYGFDDNDYCMRAKELGIPFLNGNVSLKHHENKTYQTYFKELKENMTEKNQSLFYEKWKHKLKSA